MSKIFESSWLIALAGGIVILIAFLTPAGIPRGDTDYVWMIGLSGREEITFLDHRFALYVSLFCSSIILGCTAINIIFAIFSGRDVESNPHIAWFVTPFIMVGFTIIWIIAIDILLPLATRGEDMDLPFGLYQPTYTYTLFWDYNIFGFGIYGIFIGSVILIVAAAFRKFGKKPS